jgi:hypothetical protein
VNDKPQSAIVNVAFKTTRIVKMLHIQRFIRENGLEALKTELGINVYEHPTLPLIGCKYSQIDSPRTHLVVRECRGIVLEKDTWRVIAKPFNRFFNVGEVQEEFELFDWSKFSCTEKADGSLIILYRYDGEWQVNTSGSFGLGQAPNYDGTWRDLFWRFANIDVDKLDLGRTYIFELCTPWNKVVKGYKRPTVFLLGVSETLEVFGVTKVTEFSESLVDKAAQIIGAQRPRRYKFSRQEEVANLMVALEDDINEVHEGVIIRDRNGMRYKWKTANYVALHRLKDNGNVILPKNLVKIAVTGESPEVLAVMPEIRTALTEVQLTLTKTQEDIWLEWSANRAAESQKEFALAVKGHKFAWVLFALRKAHLKYGGIEPKHIEGLFRDNINKISAALFGKRTFEFDVEIEDEVNVG